MKPGDSLVSTISMPKGLVLHAQLRNKIERGVEDSSPIRTAAVLTCVAEPQPPDAFRPAFCDRQAEDLPGPQPQARTAAHCRRHQEHARRRSSTSGSPSGPGSGPASSASRSRWRTCRSTGWNTAASSASRALLLCTDLKPEQKEPLLINFVQVGIDLGGMIRAGHPGWTGWGGHGSGRKLPIVFAGLLLGDDATGQHQPSPSPRPASARMSRPPTAIAGPAPRWSSPGIRASTRPRASAAIAAEATAGDPTSTRRPRSGRRARTPASPTAAAAPASAGSPRPWPCG